MKGNKFFNMLAKFKWFVLIIFLVLLIVPDMIPFIDEIVFGILTLIGFVKDM